VEPTLILWALVRELRGLWQARERDRLGFQSAGGGWNQASKPTPRALKRIGKMPLARLIRRAGRTDRTIKGIAPGDPWSEIIGLTAEMAGALQASPDSGRVPI
jgi:DNA polymerase-3 subunit delta